MSEEKQPQIEKVKELATTGPTALKHEATGTIEVHPEYAAQAAQDAARRKEKEDRLEQLTIEITSAQRAFVTIADGVFEIEKEKLWVLRPNSAGETYGSLADFMEEQFQFDSVETSRYKTGGKVLAILREHNVTKLPQVEAQTRALNSVLTKTHKNKAKMVEVWQKVSKSGNPTAERIEQEGGIVRTSATPRTVEKFEGKALLVSVTVATEDAAKVLSENFAPKSSSDSVKGNWVVDVGVNSAVELETILHYFDDAKLDKLTLTIQR